ncbi:glucose-1-phosphate thymidylyltransferase [Planobispora siamensis]|uniref:Glucose-1-phosphate thymidylyltransferase n=1 Tax=Planobispora siamensis TaxID=936338 RepID=A0A8J3SSJ1_9ACTN|nr:glucose-1-phosphate thymidylyltransferase [Planobispora siamensis]GIH94843.1 glucose-1-phosphate thymidylyltransferase [Planobispora siamensis]
MKALVLSGGSGTRLRPFSYSMPKQLIPIAGRPVLEHVLGNIRDLGVTEVGIVVGAWAGEIAAAIGDGSRLGLRVTYIRQDRPLGLAHAVRTARGFLGDDDFVMYLGDVMLPDGVADLAERFRAERPAAQVVVHRVADPRGFGVVELDAGGAVRRLVEKPRRPRSDLALVGVYFFGPAIHEAVTAVAPGRRGELEITDAIQWLVTRGAKVAAVEYGGYWKDTGQADDVLECNRHLLGGLGGRAVVHPTARVVRSLIEGPAIVGANTVIEDCHLGPGVSIGRDCVLRGTRLSDSIVLDGASIEEVRGMHGSIIGRSAVVRPADRDGMRHRLLVGDNTRIEIPVSI